MYVRVSDAWYTVEEEGYKEPMPVIHVTGRDQQWQRQYVRIDGFRPYFCVTESEYERVNVEDDDRVIGVQRVDERDRDEQSFDGEPAVRIVCRTPGDVGELREFYENPLEADVRFPVRFLVDKDAYQWLQIETDCDGTDGQSEAISVHADDVPLADDPPENLPPFRTVTYDIEVKQGGSGPPVVTKEGCEQTRNPITAISAHDSYTNQYKLFVTTHRSWRQSDVDAIRDAVDCDLNIYSDSRTTVTKFVFWLTDVRPDVLTGWNASGFDHPYLFNYCLNNDVTTIYDLSPTNDVYELDGEGMWINSSVNGIQLLDLMEMYDKSTIHSLDSKRLADIAEQEGVSVSKLNIEDEIDVPSDVPAIDYAWEHEPATFAEYSLKDTQAAVGINRESNDGVNLL